MPESGVQYGPPKLVIVNSLIVTVMWNAVVQATLLISVALVLASLSRYRDTESKKAIAIIGIYLYVIYLVRQVMGAAFNNVEHADAAALAIMLVALVIYRMRIKPCNRMAELVILFSTLQLFGKYLYVASFYG